MRDPSLDAKYFCSSTNSSWEPTNDTPGTASTVSLSFIRNAILVSSGTSNGSRLNALVQAVDHLVGIGKDDLAGGQRGVRARDGHRLFRCGHCRCGRDPVGGRKAPRAVHQDAQAEAAAGRPRHVLDLPLARAQRFAPVAVDADVGVRGTQRRGPRQRGIRHLTAQRIVRGTLVKGFGPRRHGARRDQRAARRDELATGDPPDAIRSRL